jgi:hypothetical protein
MMRESVRFFGIAFVTTCALSTSPVFSQVQTTQSRIPQQIVINGQNASGAYVTAGGQIQRFTCPSPQQYAAADGSSRGWACYEPTTGVWLLNATPAEPQAAAPAPQLVVPQSVPQAVPQQPAVVYQQAPPTVVYQPAPAVVYEQPAVIYRQPSMVIVQQPPAVVYAPMPRPVVVAPGYPASVVLGSAVIEAAGRIASAVIINTGRPSGYVSYNYYNNHTRRSDGGRRR